ncbi:MAG: hypothetical protein KBA03_00955, partial [Anaerolineaceae bacterium]|nr:hypothetical protein [Anaerolineaceae bacterium]
MFNQEKLSPRDLELLAAAVDQMLSASEQVEFNKRLGESQHFAESYRQQQKLKQLMAQLPTRSVPHNFTLTRAEAKNAKRSAFWQPMFGWASAISAILFATIFGSELIFNNYSASPALMAKEAPSLNESVPMAAPMDESEDLPAHVINWNYSGFDGIGGKGGAGGISDSGGVGINIFLVDVPDVAVEDQVEEFSLSAEGPADQISEESLEEAPEIRALPEEEAEEFEMLSAAPEEELEGLSAIQDEEVTESEAIPKTTPEENVEPLEHEAPIIY